ncbi:DUF6022 family protein [Ktedonobacter racemifer]|uniref:Uncharacterized protein n=1 Tax=Ktedonobacter racemifer DSM 44963 TaxID=485913 RepID=D6U0B9_KTERA|nr:DUF6022 family protein [Ktedonobacter racemifer]EFH82259.1 hypothetical protein Krac_3051 [Ktedonobacter racemifer DSM 44963]
MISLEKFLSEKREVTIHTLASYIKQYIQEQCPLLLQEHQEELLRTLDQAGERAYGVFARMLFLPIQEQLKQAGFVCDPNYPGDFSTSSIEYWGPPEERDRCYWTVVRTVQGTTLGTIITRVFHDHTQFRIPLPPATFTLEETETDAIVEALSHASVRLQQAELLQRKWAPGQERSEWEYSIEIGLADYIDSRSAEITGTLLDRALSLWGQNGWELVTIVPRQERLIAFFKRPAKGN